MGATSGVLLAGLFFGHFGFQVPQAARSQVRALGYAGTCTFANVFLALAGTALVSL